MNDIVNCKDCRHWDPSGEGGWGPWEPPEGWGICLLITWSGDGHKDYRAEYPVKIECEDPFECVTRQDFGCTLGERAHEKAP